MSKRPRMKQIIRIAPLLLLLSAPSCKKLIEKKQQNLIIDAITSGVWLVQQYKEGTNDVTADFVGYEFQFRKDGTVSGTKSGVSTDGTWSGNANNYTITSDFPTASDPVLKLNGIWQITDSYWDYVEAEMTVSGVKYILHLIKKA